MAPSRSGGAQLQWVVFQGVDTHVSTFGGVPAGSRPVVTCPHCGDRLVLRLGSVRVWHAAHSSGAGCALTEPESALHHNAKCYLAEQLRCVEAVTIEEPCGGTMGGLVADDCEGSRIRPWVRGWSSVEVERRLGTRRPDLVLLDGERVVGAVEVWVSHRVDLAKRQEFAASRFEWIEVAATEALIPGGTAWTAEAPLAIAAAGPSVSYTCAACEKYGATVEEQLAAAARRREQAEADRRASEADRRAAEAEANERRRVFGERTWDLRARMARNGVLLKRILLFDRLRPGGVVERDALVVADVYRDGVKLGAFLGVAGDLAVLHKVGVKGGRADYADLARRARDYLGSRREAGEVIDAESEWFPMLRVLENREFSAGWAREGSEHVWPMTRGAPPSPWRVPWADDGPDCLDLLRFLFARYFAGLPVRYRWSDKTQGWFQPALLREEEWRLWPHALPGPPRAGG